MPALVLLTVAAVMVISVVVIVGRGIARYCHRPRTWRPAEPLTESEYQEYQQLRRDKFINNAR